MSPRNVLPGSRDMKGLRATSQLRCHITLRSLYLSRACIVTSPFWICVNPLSLSLFIISPFLSRRSVIMGYIYIYSISISRVSTTYFHDAGVRGGGKEVEKRCGVWIVSGNFNGWKPNFFSLFPRALLCSILLNYRVPCSTAARTKIKLANCPFIRRARTLLKYSCGHRYEQ